MGTSTELGTSSCSRKKRLFLSVHVNDIEMAARHQNVEEIVEKCGSGRTNIIS